MGKELINITTENDEISLKPKPLIELYNESVKDDSHDHIALLLFAIESAISNFDKNEEELTDSRIINTLEKLAMKPEMESSEPLMKQISLQIRSELSTGNYSRANLRQSLRKIIKSAKLHNESGKRGYIDFIHNFLPNGY